MGTMGCATLGPPSAEILGPPTLEVDALARAARRNGIAGEAILVGGGALGLGSGALMLTSTLRKCGQLSPGCNDGIDTASMTLGASSLFVTAIGAVFFAIGYTQKRVVQKLRGQRRGP
jgi:hypothetical protein